MTDEQVNRAMTEKGFWNNEYPAVPRHAGANRQIIGDKPLGPGLNVTVPRAEPEYIGPRDSAGNPVQTLPPGFTNPKPRVSWDDIVDGYEPLSRDPLNDEAMTPVLANLGATPHVALVTAGAICQQAADITAGDRQKQNGDKLPNHENIAALWSAYLDVAIDAHQAATMMVLLKVARTKLGAFNTDDYVDMAGYAGCAAEIRHRSNQEQQ